jgi:ABC-2 type transport system ATP-binding protein
LVESLLKPEQVRVDAGALLLSVDPSQAASINRRLVSDGVDVSELRVSEQSLEDVFLELTETPTLPSPASGGGEKPEPPPCPPPRGGRGMTP